MSSARAYVHGIIPDSVNRHPEDFYPTPRAGTLALLQVERFDGMIWEPACGAGDMSKVLEETGHHVVSTDLFDRGYGTPGIDFLSTSGWRTDHIVTNPPFKHAEAFARKALDCTTGKVALLCRLAWLEGLQRRQLFENTPLARVWVFSGRLQMSRGGDNQITKGGTIAKSGGMIAFAWFVWEHGYTGKPTLGWITP